MFIVQGLVCLFFFNLLITLFSVMIKVQCVFNKTELHKRFQPIFDFRHVHLM